MKYKIIIILILLNIISCEILAQSYSFNNLIIYDFKKNDYQKSLYNSFEDTCTNYFIESINDSIYKYNDTLKFSRTNLTISDFLIQLDNSKDSIYANSIHLLGNILVDYKLVVIRIFVYDSKNNKLIDIVEDDINMKDIYNYQKLRKVINSLANRIIYNNLNEKQSGNINITKFHEFLLPFQIDYYFSNEYITNYVTKNSKKYKPPFYNFLYSPLKDIIKAYQHYKITNNYDFLKEMNNKLNKKLNPIPPQTNKESRRKKIKDNRKLIRIRKKLDKYPSTIAFLSAFVNFEKYKRYNQKDNYIDTISDYATTLFTICDTLEMEGREKKLWKNSKVNFDTEKDNLVKSVWDLKNIYSNFRKGKKYESQEKFNEALEIYTYLLQNCSKYLAFKNTNKVLFEKMIKESYIGAHTILEIINMKYLNLLLEGDNYYEKEKYLEALECYKNAVNVKPNSVFPFKKIKEIKRLLNDDEKKYVNKKEYLELDSTIDKYILDKLSKYNIYYKLSIIYPKISRSGISKEILIIDFNSIYKGSLEDIINIQFDTLKVTKDKYIKNINYSHFRLSEYTFPYIDVYNKVISLLIKDIFNFFGTILSTEGISIVYLGSSDATRFKGNLKDYNKYKNIMNNVVCSFPDSTNCQRFSDLLIGNSYEKNKALAYLRAYQSCYDINSECDDVIRDSKIYTHVARKKGGHYRFVHIQIVFKIDKEKFGKDTINLIKQEE